MDSINSSAAPSEDHVPQSLVEPGHFKDLACEDICTEHHFNWSMHSAFRGVLSGPLRVVACMTPSFMQAANQ